MDAIKDLYGIKDLKQAGRTVASSGMWVDAQCSECGAGQLLVIVARSTQMTGSIPDLKPPKWLRCVVCLRAMVMDGDGQVHPGAKPFREPSGLPAVDKRVWAEARTCLGVGAYTAAVMLCRKLLFHIAVAKGLPPKDGRDWAPSFKACVEHLEEEGIVSKPMLGWVDRIKDVGNDASHEITPVSKDDAMAVATFTEMLLVLAYEMTARMEAQGATPAVEPPA